MKRTLSILTLIVVILSSTLVHAGYSRQLHRYTKSAKMFELKNFEAVLIWNATFFSDQFRKAYEDRHIKLYQMEPADALQYRAEQNYEQTNGWEFFIGFYTQRPYKKFSNDLDSFWKIYLTTESGEKLHPVSVELVPITPYELKMFPYLDRWTKGYRVTFPKVPLGKKFSLTLHSIEGTSVLKWKKR